MLERAVWHDYHSVCIYMITLTKQEAVPAFSSIHNAEGAKKTDPVLSLSPVGLTVDAEVRGWLKEFAMIRLLNMRIMPDHIHILIYVTERTEKHLSRIIQVLKWNCNRALQTETFCEGFNDKIVTKEGQRETFYQYISDNPRRYMARKLYPEYFQRVQIVEINGRHFSLYGNLFLLNHPVKTQVRFSRSFSAEELEVRQRDYEETIRCGGVVVSPFIHREEKKWRQRAVEGGASVIQVVMNGFSERFKPSGRDFNLCLEGRLLLVAPTEYESRRVDLDREAAMAANGMAQLIAALGSQNI